MEKGRFIFGEDMTKEQMLEVILKLAKEHGVKAICESKKTPTTPNRKS